jgi:6-pyruvoyltetrahydropterin/6-carboxytetrahydropterin synthase
MKLKLDGWELGVTFSACHFLPGHSKCNRLHGHNYAIHLEMDGEPQDNGVVYDFVDLKSIIKGIAKELDHCVLMPGESDLVDVKVEGGSVHVKYEDKSYSFPKEDVNVLNIDVVSAEVLAAYVLDRVLGTIQNQPNLHRIGVGVDEGRGQGAWAWKEL